MLTKVLEVFNVKNRSTLEESKFSEFPLTEKKREDSVLKEIRTFRLVIPSDSWKNLQTKKRYNNRNYAILKQGKWTSKFARKIYDRVRIECPFSFQRIKIYESNKSWNFQIRLSRMRWSFARILTLKAWEIT